MHQNITLALFVCHVQNLGIERELNFNNWVPHSTQIVNNPW
jgi:hypothetical protein